MSDAEEVGDGASVVSSAASVRRASSVENFQSSMSTAGGPTQQHHRGQRRATVRHRLSVDPFTGHPGPSPAEAQLDDICRMQPLQHERFRPAVVENMLGKARIPRKQLSS